MNHKMEWMHIAIEQAKKAYKRGDVPVGAVIVKNNKIIAKAYNKKEKQNNAIQHAEIIAIAKACKKLKTWHLEECTLYVTLEPCMMCTGAIIQSRIKTIEYAAPNPNHGFINSKYDLQKMQSTMIKTSDSKCVYASINLLQSFFKERRK